jgi:hypothetical protein
VRHVLRHRSASRGSLVNLWELDFTDHNILASIQVASAPLVHVVIRVRNIWVRDRSRSEFAITCLDGAGETWAIENGVFDAELPQPILPSMSLILGQAPASTSAVLQTIGAAPR